MSHNPFGFYSTYITEKAFDLYMKSLEKWNKAGVTQGYACQPVTAIRHHPNEDREPKLKAAQVNETSYNLGDGYSTTIEVELSLTKMVDAVGQRSPMGKPTAVMWQSPNMVSTTCHVLCDLRLRFSSWHFNSSPELDGDHWSRMGPS